MEPSLLDNEKNKYSWGITWADQQVMGMEKFFSLQT